MVRTRVKKYTVCRMELKIKDKTGLYAFLPFEQLDRDNKAVFKIGLTANDLQDRLENYHTYFPEGVYIVFFLSFEESLARNMYKRLESLLFKAIMVNGGNRLQFTSRPGRANDYQNSEWFYPNWKALQTSFYEIQEKHGGIMHEYNLENINQRYRNRKDGPEKLYNAEILFNLGKIKS